MKKKDLLQALALVSSVLVILQVIDMNDYLRSLQNLAMIDGEIPFYDVFIQFLWYIFSMAFFGLAAVLSFLQLRELPETRT